MHEAACTLHRPRIKPVSQNGSYGRRVQPLRLSRVTPARSGEWDLTRSGYTQAFELQKTGVRQNPVLRATRFDGFGLSGAGTQRWGSCCVIGRELPRFSC